MFLFSDNEFEFLTDFRIEGQKLNQKILFFLH